jgi:hypothetical protein
MVRLATRGSIFSLKEDASTGSLLEKTQGPSLRGISVTGSTGPFGGSRRIAKIATVLLPQIVFPVSNFLELFAFGFLRFLDLSFFEFSICKTIFSSRSIAGHAGDPRWLVQMAKSRWLSPVGNGLSKKAKVVTYRGEGCGTETTQTAGPDR